MSGPCPATGPSPVTPALPIEPAHASRFASTPATSTSSWARPTAARAIHFRVLLDGSPVGEAAGADARPDGRGLLNEQRTYQLIRQPGPVAERTFEIEFDDAGAEAYCFTFG